MSETESDRSIEASPVAEAEAPVETPSDPSLVCVLDGGTKVKQRLLRMRACNEKNDKGKICAGHLKRWYRFGPDVAGRFGADAEVYRCEKCHTLYLPHPDDPRTGSLSY